MAEAPQTAPRLYTFTGVALGIDADGPLVGVLFEGPPGSGKTCAALGLIADCPWRRTRLIGDDGVSLWSAHGRLMAAPPEPTAGVAEARGAGLMRLSPVNAPVVLILNTAPDRPRYSEIDDAAPLGDEGPKVPKLGCPRGLDAIRPLVRSVLSGHSGQGAVPS